MRSARSGELVAPRQTAAVSCCSLRRSGKHARGSLVGKALGEGEHRMVADVVAVEAGEEVVAVAGAETRKMARQRRTRVMSGVSIAASTDTMRIGARRRREQR